MRTSAIVLISYHFAALFGAVEAFTTPASLASPKSCLHSTATADDETIPTNLPSDCGMDYVPLATMLATEQFEEADQVRDEIENPVHGVECVAVECRQSVTSRPKTYNFDFCALLFYLSFMFDGTKYNKKLLSD